MAKILYGREVVAALNEKLVIDARRLKLKGVAPMLAIVRVGERGDDTAYEKAAVKRCEAVGVETALFHLPQDVTQDDLLKVIDEINRASDIHGCLLFRPLPGHIDDNTVRNALSPAKDVDGITDLSLAGVFTGVNTGFPPCTPSACMEILEYYGVDLSGKKVVVIGRSLIVGKPCAMMLIQKNATVTICHTRTKDMPRICREADLLIAAAGKAGVIGMDHLSSGQTVIDVGINVNEKGKLCGDVNFTDAESIVEAITPVPGGVGAVTTSVLVKHVIEAAKIAVRE